MTRAKSDPKRLGEPRQTGTMLALTASRNVYLDLFANAPVGFVSLDPEGRIRRINHAALAILGQTARSLTGLPFEMFVALVDVPAWRDHLRRAKATHGAATADICLPVGSRPLVVQASTSHLAEDGECTMTALVDVTERTDASKLLELFDRAKICVAAEVTPKRVLEALPPIAVPLLSDWCVAELRDTLGETVQTSSTHAIPNLVPALRLVASRMGNAPALRAMTEEAVGSSRPLLATKARRFEPYEGVTLKRIDELKKLGLGSAMALPLSGRGVTMGVLVVGTTTERPPFGRREVALALELARRASLALDNARAVTELRQARVANDAAPEARATILLVEDNDDLREVTTKLLSKLHYDVRSVGTVADARREATQRPFDVLVSDIRLPDGTGLELMRDLLSRDSKLKGIALSGFASPADVDEALRAGFSAHLKKPVGFRDLSSTLLQIV